MVLQIRSFLFLLTAIKLPFSKFLYNPIINNKRVLTNCSQEHSENISMLKLRLHERKVHVGFKLNFFPSEEENLKLPSEIKSTVMAFLAGSQ